MNTKNDPFIIPADVPEKAQELFSNNYERITEATGNLLLFSCDQKIEHLNKDFYGKNIAQDTLHPEHLFSIASNGRIGAMATHPGMIARYGKKYPGITYIAKLNGKTDIVQTDQKDPVSLQLYSVDQVLKLQEKNIHIAGIGLTVYPGSELEGEMLQQVAQTIFYAHQQGLVTIVWIYPRGKAIKKENTLELSAGAAGLANALGADFVKIKAPQKTKEADSARLLKIVTAAAGNTKVICSGGPQENVETFLQNLYDQIHIGHCAGTATGRNIFQRSRSQAIAMTEAIAAIIYDNKSVEQAMAIYKQLK